MSGHRRSALGLLAALFALVFAMPASASADCAGADAEPVVQGLQAAGAATICLVNTERAAHGLGAVALQMNLTDASQRYSDFMVARGFFAHETPEGVDLVTRLTSAGYINGTLRSWVAGENLAWGRGTPATPGAIFAAWRNSPGHRANILNGEYAEIGIGGTSGTPSAGANGATYATDFGTRELPSRTATPATPAAAAPAATNAVAAPAKPAVSAAAKRAAAKR